MPIDDLTGAMTRAELLRRAAAAGLAVTSVPLLAACGGGTDAAGDAAATGAIQLKRGSTVKLYNWEGYDDAKNLKAFKADEDVTVRPTYIAGDQEVFTKLGAQKGQGQWDVLTYNSGLVPQLFAQGLLDPLRPQDFANAKDIYPEFSSLPQIKASGGALVGLPFSWGYQGFIRTRKLPAMTSWQGIFDPALKGRLIGVNDPTTSIATMALVLGYTDYARLTPEQFDKVMQGWERLRPSLRTIVPDYGVAKDVLVRGEADGCVPGWQAMVVNAAKDGTTLIHDIPREGVYGFLDLLCLIKGSKNAGTARGLIDFMLSPAAQANLAVSLSQGITNQQAVPRLPRVLQDAYEYDQLAANFKRSPIRPLPSSGGDGVVTFADWAQAWERFTAAG